MVDAHGVSPSGRYRLRYVVKSLWQPARVPADLNGCGIVVERSGERPDRDVLRW